MNFNRIWIISSIHLIVIAAAFLTSIEVTKSMEMPFRKGKRKTAEDFVIPEQEKKLKIEKDSAIESPGPVFLHVINNTNYDFQLFEAENSSNLTMLAMLPKHESTEYRYLPLYQSNGYWHKHVGFMFKTNGQTAFMVSMYLHIEEEKTTILLQRGIGLNKFTTTVSTDPANQFHILITINGNPINNFFGTTIQLKEIKIQKA